MKLEQEKTEKRKRAIVNEQEVERQEDIDASEDIENIKELGVQSVPDADESIQILPIIGQIEGHNIGSPQTKATKYEHVIPQLIAMERDKKVKGILVVLNTVGGDVEAGLAIAEMINSLTKPTVSLVIGGGHSIGVPLATSSNYSFISPTATMIVHPIRMNGLVIGVPQTFEYFRKMQERIIEFIVRTSKVSDEQVRKMMAETDELLNDMGTIVIGKQAVECGLIDEVGGISQALEKLNELIGDE
ncbi:MAG: ClpP family protease [Clostridium sp.]